MSNNYITAEYIESLKHKTPFFLFSRKNIVDKYKEFSKNFPGAKIQYAMKANSEPEILRVLLEEGAGFEVASVYELEILQKIGVKPERIFYGSSIKPIEQIRAFYDYGVSVFAFDSFSELEKIATAAPGASVYCRMAVNDAGSVFKFSEKFGAEKLNIAPLLQHAKKLGLRPLGISFHVGSQASNLHAWGAAIEDLWDTFVHLQKLGIELEILNIGGGFPTVYESTENTLDLKDIAKTTLEQFEKLPYKPKLVLEPGRGIVASTGILIASVIGRVERGSAVWIFLDAGVYNALFEAMAYQGSTRYKITSLRPPFNSEEMLYSVAGPTGDSPDIITREALLPKDLQVGDRLIIHDVGAYSLTVTSPFNGFPKPDVYYI